jgi:hypothetical protein
MNTYIICYSSLETGDVIFLDTYPSVTEARQRLRAAIKNYMADEEPDAPFEIFDKKDCDFDAILNDESFPEGIVYRIKSHSAKVYEKKVEYEETAVVGYLRPYESLTHIGKISIIELYVDGVRGAGGSSHIAPPPRKRPPKQTVSFMAELGEKLQSGVKLNSTKRSSKPKINDVIEDISTFIERMN